MPWCILSASGAGDAQPAAAHLVAQCTAAPTCSVAGAVITCWLRSKAATPLAAAAGCSGGGSALRLRDVCHAAWSDSDASLLPVRAPTLLRAVRVRAERFALLFACRMRANRVCRWCRGQQASCMQPSRSATAHIGLVTRDCKVHAAAAKIDCSHL